MQCLSDCFTRRNRLDHKAGSRTINITRKAEGYKTQERKWALACVGPKSWGRSSPCKSWAQLKPANLHNCLHLRYKNPSPPPSSAHLIQLEAGNKSPKFLKPRKVWKWNKLPFFVPFQEILPPCSSIAAVFKIHRDLRRNHSQSVKRKILRRLRWNWTLLQRAGQKGGALALMLQRLVAARVAAGTLLSARHPASAREPRGRAAARPGLCPPPPRLCLPVPHAIHLPAGSEPGCPHSAGSAGSGQQTPGRITISKKKKKKPRDRCLTSSPTENKSHPF